MTTAKQSEILTKLKELKDLSKKAEANLEKYGISITDLNRKQLFDNNIKNTVEAIEALLRNEPAERPTLRLKREIPDSFNNIKKLKESNAGKLASADLDRLHSLMSYFEQNYEKL